MGPAYSARNTTAYGTCGPRSLNTTVSPFFRPWSLDKDLPASRGTPLVFGGAPSGTGRVNLCRVG